MSRIRGWRAWTGAHDAWLRRIRFDQAGTRAAFEADDGQVQITLDRRDRLDAAITAEHSSGEKHTRGGITKTGNSHARRLLVEAAWHHKPADRRGTTILDRCALAPARSRNTRHTVATTAIARELAHWCWSLAGLD